MQHLPDLAHIFGAVLLEARKSIPGLSQEKLAEAAGLERAYISRLERGLALPTLTVVFLLSKQLGLPAAVLISRVEQRFSDKALPLPGISPALSVWTREKTDVRPQPK